MGDEWQTCSECGDDLDGDSDDLCGACVEKRWDAWVEWQDWLRMSDREREEAIRFGYR